MTAISDVGLLISVVSPPQSKIRNPILFNNNLN